MKVKLSVYRRRLPEKEIFFYVAALDPAYKTGLGALPGQRSHRLFPESNNPRVASSDADFSWISSVWVKCNHTFS